MSGSECEPTAAPSQPPFAWHKTVSEAAELDDRHLPASRLGDASERDGRRCRSLVATTQNAVSHSTDGVSSHVRGVLRETDLGGGRLTATHRTTNYTEAQNHERPSRGLRHRTEARLESDIV